VKSGWVTPARLVVGAGLAVLGLQLAVAFLGHARLVAAALRFPYPLDYREGPVLDQAVRLARFESIYPARFDTPPFTFAATPPLFQLVEAPLTRLLGPVYWYGRGLSLLGAGAAALLLGLILQAVSHDALASTAGALTFLAFPHVAMAAAQARGDLPALALSLAGLYLIVRARTDCPPTTARLWQAGLLLAAAIFTRQTYALAVPLAAGLWLWGWHQRRAAWMLAGVTSGTAAALALVLGLATRGGFFHHLGFATFGPVAPGPVTAQWAGLYVNAGYLVVAGLVFIVVDPLGDRSRAWPLVLACIPGAALISLAAGQPGGSGADLLAVLAVLSLSVGALCAWTGERFWFRTGLLLVLALQVNQLAKWSREDYYPLLTQKLAQARQTRQLAELVRQAPGPVLADEFMGLLPLYGRRLDFQPLEYRYLQAAGQWDPAPLIAAVQRQEFAAILMYQPRLGPGLAVRWAPEIREAIYAHYETHQTLADTLVYVPRGAGE
jgi:hypothetical protein